MILAGKGLTHGYLDEAEVYGLLKSAFDQLDLAAKKVLVLIPDKTRTCPLPMLFRAMVDLLLYRVRRLDFLIALGTHQPMPQAEIYEMLGICNGERNSIFQKVGIFNHMWSEPGTFAMLGEIPAKRIREVTGGRMDQTVPIGVNRMIFDYDQLMILGPTFPHEVVGFSGGLKYIFPGISQWDFINFFHWFSAVITCIKIIGTKDTPVRALINEAAQLIKLPIVNINLVVHHHQLAGCFIGDPHEAWSHAADLSEKLHIVYKEEPYKLVIGIAPKMYDDIWVAGKVMYKLEPIVADGGELIIYAPHVKEISFTHGKYLEEIGYHVRDYFLKQWEKFRHIPGGVLAHSTHVRGIGTFENGVEKPRITVTLATGIPRERVEKVCLKYLDPNSLDVDSFRGREKEGILVVDHAGETLYRLRNPEGKITIYE
ncbi:MAG: lactate racemase domain-containing protein [Thermoguttaceae bacterium]|nr:lactate racemase domain-containing protein [Thermoguttaceae bacterium]MDW8079453.1 lactate racemase domain-containing protein [Thermoguttaceae bacterium]